MSENLELISAVGMKKELFLPEKQMRKKLLYEKSGDTKIERVLVDFENKTNGKRKKIKGEDVEYQRNKTNTDNIFKLIWHRGQKLLESLRTKSKSYSILRSFKNCFKTSRKWEEFRMEGLSNFNS